MTGIPAFLVRKRGEVLVPLPVTLAAPTEQPAPRVALARSTTGPGSTAERFGYPLSEHDRTVMRVLSSEGYTVKQALKAERDREFFEAKAAEKAEVAAVAVAVMKRRSGALRELADKPVKRTKALKPAVSPTRHTKVRKRTTRRKRA